MASTASDDTQSAVFSQGCEALGLEVVGGAAGFDLPVPTGVTVERLSRAGPGFRADVTDGRYTADNVVVATGMCRTPRVPGYAAQLDPSVHRLHSSEYRNPRQLPPGPVLVVGAGNSGAEIARELARTHRTWLSGRDTGQEPPRAGSLPDRLVTPLMWLAADRVLTVGSPIGRKARDHLCIHPAASLWAGCAGRTSQPPAWRSSPA